MKYFIPILFFLSAHGQRIVQVSSHQYNGRLDEWHAVPEKKKDTFSFIRDTVYMDSAQWPNKRGKITRETVYIDPAAEKPYLTVSSGTKTSTGTLTTTGTMVDLSKLQTYTTASDSAYIGDGYDSPTWINVREHKTKRHRRKKTVHHHKVGKVHTQKVKADVEYDSYLMFSGYGEVLDRSDGMVTIEKAKGRFYYKKVKR